MTKIRAAIILEMLGRPKDYLKETLIKLVDRLENEKGIKIIERKISEPKEIDEKNIFSCFADLEIEADDFNAVLVISFVYMPSHLEIITPEEIKMKNHDFSTLFNELARRLHQYDEIAKRLTIENNIIKNKLAESGVLAEKEKNTKKKSKAKSKKKN
ncbi:MAG: hypothetical protein ABIH72_03700 [archaeon]